MAALSDAAFPRLVDLRQLRSEDLEALLDEESDEWQRTLDWDFRGSAELVQRFVALHSLTGYALVNANRVVGYIYYVCEERKGLIGDLYVSQRFRTEEAEDQLLTPVLETLAGASWVKRIESQLMMLSNQFERVLPFADKAVAFPRTFMEARLDRVGALPPKARDIAVNYYSWTDRCQEEAARVIAEAYRGHIDSNINDQYRTVSGARRFLSNIVQYPGCGTFFQPASLIALDASGRACGICLSSLVQHEVGHITQICVTPSVRGRGVGYELLRQSMTELRRHGCRKASLTVTSANDHAIELYESVGFKTKRTFAAYVWDGL